MSIARPILGLIPGLVVLALVLAFKIDASRPWPFDYDHESCASRSPAP